MPLPPADVVEAAEAAADPEFEFTKVECLLLAFHTVGKQAPEYLTENPEILKDFRIRLQYFARGVQGYIRKLKEFLANKSKSERLKEENKIKSVALKCTLNNQTLIKDLFHTPPSYKAKIIVSWKDDVQEKKVTELL